MTMTPPGLLCGCGWMGGDGEVEFICIIRIRTYEWIDRNEYIPSLILVGVIDMLMRIRFHARNFHVKQQKLILN